jgi:hypothetical protein
MIVLLIIIVVLLTLNLLVNMSLSTIFSDVRQLLIEAKMLKKLKE